MSRIGYSRSEQRGIATDLSGVPEVGCARVAEGGVTQTVNGSPIAPLPQMPVDGEREGRRMMAELLLDVRQGLAGLDQHAGEGMAQGMGLSVAEPGAPEDAHPDIVPEGVIADRVSGHR